MRVLLAHFTLCLSLSLPLSCHNNKWKKKKRWGSKEGVAGQKETRVDILEQTCTREIKNNGSWQRGGWMMMTWHGVQLCVVCLSVCVCVSTLCSVRGCVSIVASTNAIFTCISAEKPQWLRPPFFPAFDFVVYFFFSWQCPCLTDWVTIYLFHGVTKRQKHKQGRWAWSGSKNGRGGRMEWGAGSLQFIPCIGTRPLLCPHFYVYIHVCVACFMNCFFVCGANKGRWEKEKERQDTHTQTQRERERERERDKGTWEGKVGMGYTERTYTGS